MKASVNTTSFVKQMNNIVQYSIGFIDGVQLGKKDLLSGVAIDIKELLGQYIDANARMNPEQLHHVYEWHQVGEPGARLFDIDYVVSGTGLSFSSTLMQSKSVKSGSTVPFYNKANVMEAGITVNIKPVKGSTLVFEDGDQTVFTKNDITVKNPGGNFVQGSYEETFREFFLKYLSQSFLDVTGLRTHLQTPLAFKRNLAAGAVGGRAVGLRAGKEWMTSKRSII